MFEVFFPEGNGLFGVGLVRKGLERVEVVGDTLSVSQSFLIVSTSSLVTAALSVSGYGLCMVNPGSHTSYIVVYILVSLARMTEGVSWHIQLRYGSSGASCSKGCLVSSLSRFACSSSLFVVGGAHKSC